MNTEAPGTGRTPPRGTSAPAEQAQGGPSPAFVKENIDVLRTKSKSLMTEKHEGTLLMGPLGRGAEARSRSNSKSVNSKPWLVRVSRRKSSSDSGYATVFDSGSEDLRMPYRRPKPMPFTSRITRFRYYRWAKLPPNVQLMRYGRESWPSSEERWLQSQPKSSDLLGGKRVLIEEVMALGRLAHLVKDIRQGGQKSKGPTKGKKEGYQHVPWYQLMDFPVVVDALIEGFRVRRIHVDGGSSSEAKIDKCIAYVDALRDRGIDARVVVEAVDREEVEMGVRGPVKVRIDRVTHPVIADDIPKPA
ncbi:hypothetical protein Tco_1251868 [Tanacetum coccineum]